jgi:lipopolysaccharide cholinephosphotransferase
MATHKSPYLIERNLSQARKILLTVTSILDKKNISYHLEGGALLGIVRDGDLLPWDNDVDISIPSEFGNKIPSLRINLLIKGYTLSVRKSKIEAGPIKIGDYSIFKVKPIIPYIIRWFYPSYESIVMDIFVKKENHTHTYWQAMEKPMRVDKKYYYSFETLTYQNHVFKVPNQYRDYLTEKYGDWSIPVKEWDCSIHEQTLLSKKE